MSESISDYYCPNCNNDKMNSVTGFDDPNKGYAYNLYNCSFCGIVAKQDVWSNKKVTVIYIDGTIETVSPDFFLKDAKKFEPF